MFDIVIFIKNMFKEKTYKIFITDTYKFDNFFYMLPNSVG